MTNPDYEQWIKLQQEAAPEKTTSKPLHRKKFVGDRGYLHFDGRVSISRVDGSDKTDPAYRLLTSAANIEKHSFLPFLREDQRVRKYRDKAASTPEGDLRRHDQQYPTIKNRPIMYASHLDASVYSLYNSILGKQYEQMVIDRKLSSTVIAYRPVSIPGTTRNKSNIDFAKELYEKIKDSKEDVGILLLDVSGFFDNLKHKRLYGKWCIVLNSRKLPSDHKAIFDNISQFRYVFASDAYKSLGLDTEDIKSLRKKRRAVLCGPAEFNAKIKKQNLIHKNKSGSGIPQGSPISGLLANIYMLDFDTKVKALTDSLGGAYMRYSDDIAVLVPPSKLVGVYQEIQALISEEELKISTKKTDCFIYQHKPGRFVNVVRQLDPTNRLNIKKYPQYLGFVFTEDNIHIRGNTLARRFRGGKAFLLRKERWKYFSLAGRKTNSSSIAVQVESVRKKIKPIVKKAQALRTERNKEGRGPTNAR